ncbi:MAG: hypothetical protein OXU67_05480, partial [Chloroflexota bacterium]|nr:hypothetical protein [Chloroflexota bacterium]
MPLQLPQPSSGQDSLWRNGDFLKLWSAQTVSVTGSLLGALQLTAILALAATPFQLSLLAAARGGGAGGRGGVVGGGGGRPRGGPGGVGAPRGRGG